MKQLTDAQVIELRAKHGWAKETIRAIEAEVLRINGWHPIETAPKDATPIDIWCSEWRERAVNMRRVQLAPDNIFYEPVESGPCCVRDATHWMPLPAAPGDHIGDANKMVERRQLIEMEQRARLRERFKDRTPSPATADFDLPVACSDDTTPRAAGCPDTMDDMGHFAEVDMPAFLRKQAG